MRAVFDPAVDSKAARRAVASWILLAWIAGGAFGCAKLDATGATRCENSSDCRGGFVCERKQCVSFDSMDGSVNVLADASIDASDGSIDASDSATDANTIVMNPPDQEKADSTKHDDGYSPDDKPLPPDPHPTDEDDHDGGTDEDGGVGERVPACSAEVLLGAWPFALWLDGAHGVAVDGEGHVESWTDRTAYAHKALPTGTADTWPLRVAKTENTPPGIQFGAIDEQNVRRLLIADHPSLWFERDDFAYLVVVRYRNTYVTERAPNEIGNILTKNCGGCPLGYPGFALFANDDWGRNAGFGDGTVHSSFMAQIAYGQGYYVRPEQQGFNDDKIHVVAVQRVDSSLIMNVDGQQQRSDFVWEVDVSAVDEVLGLGANPVTPMQALDGEIFEVMALSGLSARNVDPLIDCLLAKYDAAALTPN